MAMDPGYVSTAHKPRSGVGTMKLEDIAAGIGRTCVQRSVALFNHVHRAQYAPIVANKSKAFFQPKRNGKNANSAYHLPTLEALLRFQNQKIQKRLQSTQWPSFAHAYRPHRRREDAIGSRRVMLQRLHQQVHIQCSGRLA